MNEASESNLKIEHAMETLKNNAAITKDAIIQQQQEILSVFTKKLEQQTAVLLDQVDMKYNEVNKLLMKQQADVKDYLGKAKSSQRKYFRLSTKLKKKLKEFRKNGQNLWIQFTTALLNIKENRVKMFWRMLS